MRAAADATTAALLLLSLLLDAAGRWLRHPGSWTAGAYLGRLTLVTGVIALLLVVFDRRARGAGWRLAALLLLSLSAWTRGAPAVAPDRVLLIADAVALLLWVVGWRRRGRRAA